MTEPFPDTEAGSLTQMGAKLTPLAPRRSSPLARLSPDEGNDSRSREPSLEEPGTVRALFRDCPTDSLDLQHLVRTGERTKVWRACWRDTAEQVSVKAIDVGSAALQLDLKEVRLAIICY